MFNELKINLVRRETGKEQAAQARQDEGVAIYIGPEPCVGSCEAEASVPSCLANPTRRRRHGRHLERLQSQISATMAVATIGPTAGISSSRRLLHMIGAKPLPQKADIAECDRDVRFVPILLQKSVAGFFGQ
jgi:hypothetical protein